MRKLFILIAILAFAEFGMAQTYTEGTGITGKDKLGAHQNGGRGCTGCHAPHSGAYGAGGNGIDGTVTDPDTGGLALWGQDLGPLYSQTLNFGSNGDFPITLPDAMVGGTDEQEQVITGVAMCLSCHDGNIAKGAMMTNMSYEQSAGMLPPGIYGSGIIPTLLGQDGTAAGNYTNDHPIGPSAKLSALGSTGIQTRLVATTCGTSATPCLQPNPASTDLATFMSHYGMFNVVQKNTSGGVYSGGRAEPLVMPDATVGNAYVVCTTCHTPHTMYLYSGNVRNSSTSGVYPTYFFLAAPYNPGADVSSGSKASSATQFCRQCHFTGAGGSNEGSGITTVDTQF